MRKRLKSKSLVILGAALLLMLMLATACRDERRADGETYTCPMHPTVVSDRPSTCAVCGMDLVRKARPGEEVEITGDLARLMVSPGESVVSSVRTIRGEYKSVPQEKQVQGVVAFDNRRVSAISARVSGRIEKLLLRYPYQKVRKGQRVADVYSPELLAGQREFLLLLPGDPNLVGSARRRLTLLGMTSGQIQSIERTGKPLERLPVFSDQDGYLLADAGAELIREGDYVSPGQALFTIAKEDAMVIELSVPGDAWPGISEGSALEWKTGSGRTVSSRVGLIQPFMESGKSFLKLRVYPDEPQDLRIGEIVVASISPEVTDGLWVPRSAIVDLGLRKVVFVKENGTFKPRTVNTGAAGQGMIEVVRGLASGDDIASNAQFLVDSESLIKTR